MLQGAFDAMAMGNYPFASSYMGGALPPWPMRAACDILADESPSDGELLRVRPSYTFDESTDAFSWLPAECNQHSRVTRQAMSKAVGLLYNATGDKACYNQGDLVGPASPGDTWLFQWCTQRAGQELPYYPANGRSDMFWDQGTASL